jgi:osmoprotectant transport system substrate-binding protein
MRTTIGQRGLTLGATVAVAALVLAACGSSNNALAPPPVTGSSSPGTITIGSANFPENVLLADIYAGALKAKGVNVTTKLSIGAREVYIPALKDGSIDLIPEYNGTLLAYFTQSKIPDGVSTSAQVYDALVKTIPPDLEILEQSAAEDKDTLAVTRATADKFNLRSISDLTGRAQDLTIAAGPEFAKRRTGIPGLQSVYGLTFKEFKPLDAGGPLTVAALKSGAVDVGNIFSTDSVLKTEGFVALSDPKNLFLAENIVPLIRKSKNNATVTAALNAVSAKLTTQNLTDALARVKVDKANPEAVAADFLAQQGLS